MAVLTLILIFVPYIPGLNRLPQLLGVHRLIWRDHYREQRAAVAAGEGSGGLPAAPA
jgi:hypothetical protein